MEWSMWALVQGVKIAQNAKSPTTNLASFSLPKGHLLGFSLLECSVFWGPTVGDERECLKSEPVKKLLSNPSILGTQIFSHLSKLESGMQLEPCCMQLGERAQFEWFVRTPLPNSVMRTAVTFPSSSRFHNCWVFCWTTHSFLTEIEASVKWPSSPGSQLIQVWPGNFCRVVSCARWGIPMPLLWGMQMQAEGPVI